MVVGRQDKASRGDYEDFVLGWTFILHHLGILFISLCLGEQRVRGQIQKPIKIGRYCETFLSSNFYILLFRFAFSGEFISSSFFSFLILGWVLYIFFSLHSTLCGSCIYVKATSVHLSGFCSVWTMDLKSKR